MKTRLLQLIRTITLISVILICFPVFSQIKEQNMMVDRYGQFINVDFDTKIYCDYELSNDLVLDNEYYENLKPPLDRDIYGGLFGSKEKFNLSSTGFFHIEILSNGKTVMVDPLGNVFFSLGMNGVGYIGDTYTLIKGRETIYKWLPKLLSDTNSSDYRYQAAFMDKQMECFSFYVGNKIKKTGKNFSPVDYYNECVFRLKKWGFNSEGGFSNTPGLSANRRKNTFPQVRFADLPKKDMMADVGLFDIFKPLIEEDIRSAFKSQNIDKRSGDSCIIGYFIGNEFEYHKFKSIIPTKKASETASKIALVEMLKKKYNYNIDAYNTSWETSFRSFDDLLESALIVTTDAALNDMYSFFEIYLDKLYGTISRIFREFDRNHLLLGDRYFVPCMNESRLREILCKVAGKYMDVISYNYYTYDIDQERLKSMFLISGKPIMLTEFHYGEPTQGQTGAVRMVDSEQEKGLAYRNYVEKAVTSGVVIGTHWFEYLDQSITGRWFQGYNGESFACGLINVTDRPYKEFLTSVMETNYGIYDLVLGKKEHFSFTFGPGRTERNTNNAIEIPKASKKIIIDGIDESAWSGIGTITLTDKDRVLGTRQDNASATIKLMWDEKYMYVFARISDNTPMTNQNTGQEIWNGDGLELFIGPNNVNQGGSIQLKDAQIIIGANANKPAYYWYNGRPDQPKIDIALFIAKNNKSYSIEAAIPMDKLNLNPVAAGTEFRFDVGFDAGDTRQRNAQYMWNGTENNPQNREKWGTAKFVIQ